MQCTLEERLDKVESEYEALRVPYRPRNFDFWAQYANVVSRDKSCIDCLLWLDKGKIKVSYEFDCVIRVNRRNLKAQCAALEDKESLIRRYILAPPEGLVEQGRNLRRAFCKILMNPYEQIYLRDCSHSIRIEGNLKRKRLWKQLIQAYGLTPTEDEIKNNKLVVAGYCWDLVWGDFEYECMLGAVRLYSHSAKRLTMQAIFGIDGAEKFPSPHNTLLLPKSIKARIFSGLVVIVPDVPLDATAEHFHQWQLSEPKDYVFRVLQDNEEMNETMYKTEAGSMKLRDLNGQRLVWRNSFRPRPKYLYYLYCLNVLRFVYTNREKENAATDDLPREFAKKYWGSPDKYGDIREGMARVLTEEIGYSIEDFLGNAGDTGENTKTAEDVILTAALTEGVINRTHVDYDSDHFSEDFCGDRGETDDWEDEEDEEDEEEEDSDGYYEYM